MMRKVFPVVLVAMVLPLPVLGQQLILWKVANHARPVLVPTYAGQPSPFPKIKDGEEEDAALSAEAEAARQARLAALSKAERLMGNKLAFAPELGVLSFHGRLDGPAGPKVLILNQWVGVGRQLNLRLVRTDEMNAAIDELRQYDSDAANSMDAKLEGMLANRPMLNLTIRAIRAKEVELGSEYGRHIIPIHLDGGE